MKFETKTHTLKCPVDIEVTLGEGDDATTETVRLKKVTISTPKGPALRKIMRFADLVDQNPTGYSHGDLMMDSIEAMSDMPDGSIDLLHPRDITILGDISAPFLEEAMGGGPLSQNSPDGIAETKPK